MPPARSTDTARQTRADAARAVPRQRSAAVPPAAQPPSGQVGDVSEVQRWQARPVAARAVQVIVIAVPVAASLVCAALVSNALPHARHLVPTLGWWAVVVASSTLTLLAVDRVARRLLPLALLLRLSLVFPDQAPKRYRIAARSWSTRRVHQQIAFAHTTDATDAPPQAAQQVISLLASLAVHDRRTRGHCERVRAYNDLLAEELGLSEADRDRLRWAALIHDIGKLNVSTRVLNKPGKPTAREWEILRSHPTRGAEIAAPLAAWLGEWFPTIEQHHEHWDGTGYPHGLAGEDISLGARIVGVADAYEVMTSPRPYNRPMSPAAARAELANCAGTHFDPHVVRAFLNVSIGRLRKAMGPIAFFAQVPFLASMPRLSAALIHGGQQAAVGAGAAAGVVAISAVPASATHHVHDLAASHHRVAVVQTAPAPDPLVAVLGLRAAPPVPTPKPTATHHRGKSAAARHGHKRAHGPRDHGQVQAHGHTNGTAATHAQSAAHANAAAHRKALARGKSATHRTAVPHGASATTGATAANPSLQQPLNTRNATSATRGRCAGNNGAGVGNGGSTDSARSKTQPTTAVRSTAVKHC